MMMLRSWAGSAWLDRAKPPKSHAFRLQGGGSCALRFSVCPRQGFTAPSSPHAVHAYQIQLLRNTGRRICLSMRSTLLQHCRSFLSARQPVFPARGGGTRMATTITNALHPRAAAVLEYWCVRASGATASTGASMHRRCTRKPLLLDPPTAQSIHNPHHNPPRLKKRTGLATTC